MKKSFLALLLTAAFSISMAAPTDAPAPKSADSASRLEEAKQYYVNSAVDGLKIAQMFNGQKFTDEQIADARKAIANWCDTELVPFLRRNDLLDEWERMQFDAKIREYNRRLADTKDPKKFTELATEANAFIQKNYPATQAKLMTPEGIKMMQKLQLALLQTILK